MEVLPGGQRERQLRHLGPISFHTWNPEGETGVGGGWGDAVRVQPRPSRGDAITTPSPLGARSFPFPLQESSAHISLLPFSSFAESLFDKPYTIKVEDAEVLDLKEFDRQVHDGIVLDSVNSFQQLRRWRALLQARNQKVKGGESRTQVYAYAQYLFGAPIAATVDFDAPDEALMVAGKAAGRSSRLMAVIR